MLMEIFSNDNEILLLELLQPNKTDVLGYLSGRAGPTKRWTRVTITQSATEEAHVTNYMVFSSFGMLDITSDKSFK